MFGKKAAIRRYQQTLPRELSKRYGVLPQWTPHQVRATILELGLNRAYIDYAIYEFCGEKAYLEYGGSPEKSGHIGSYLLKAGFVSGVLIGGGGHSDWLIDTQATSISGAGSGSDGGSGGGGD